MSYYQYVRGSNSVVLGCCRKKLPTAGTIFAVNILPLVPTLNRICDVDQWRILVPVY